ncbi:osteomodulin-like [Diadema setosum]|uniref:osteomodulin-like n=1 Tax=Diadema setosum TaxID=31175 RepID=UPI003B3A392C
MLLVLAILGSLANASSVEASPCNIFLLSADCKSRSLRTVPENIPCDIVRIALQMNRLPAVHADDFACFSSLRQLDLSTNEIRISNIQGIVHLDLSVNSLAVISDFGPMTALKILQLQHNRIERIHENAFAGLLSLEWLTYLPPGLFSACSKLAHLDVSANPLMNISNQLFHGLANPTWLDLSSTDLSLRQIQALDGNPAPAPSTSEPIPDTTGKPQVPAGNLR